MLRAARSLSLSHRIVASVALGLGLILALFGLLVLWTISESAEAAYRERVVLAQALAQRVDDILRQSLATLHQGADRIVLQAGQSLLPGQRLVLSDLRLQMGTFSILSVTAADGTVLWTDPGRPDVVIGQPLDHPSVKLAIRTNTTQIAEVLVPGHGEGLVACLAVPLHGPDGSVTGAAMAALDPAHPALNLLPTEDVASGMHVQLADRSGRLLAGTEIAANGVPTHGALLSELAATHTPTYRVHQPAASTGIEAHVVAYAPVRSLPSWAVVAEQPRDLVLATPSRLQQRLTLFGLAALAIAVGVAWLDVRRVVRPLHRLTATAQRFAAGNLDQPVTINRSDELGILARAFETMRQRLRSSLAEVAEWNRELERRVAVRTAEVEKLNESLTARERERAELLQMIMRGQEEERRRLAQELHDDTSQALATLQLGLERLAAGGQDPADARRVANQLHGLAGQALSDVHRLAVELRPSVLDDVGLPAAVQRYLQEWPRRQGLAVDFAAVGIDGLRLIPAAETAVYRIVQAAVTNVVHHSQAQHVNVLLERRADRLVVVVEDDGRGFDLDTVRGAPLERRLGLAGMEERAALIGATLTVETAPGAGTSLFLEVPLPSNCPREATGAEAAHSTG